MFICIQTSLINVISQGDSLFCLQKIQKKVEQYICQKLKYFFKN
ncbi:unnamed protein product [Paramecium primaurelia]|uniref:Uncharacterized protein n=1 Tax=Paramecium primaurelia TaxID=5886 RepID=A0A8S1QL48_PARPR|nr:unnamed protein product [Paramecium primaurelia]